MGFRRDSFRVNRLGLAEIVGTLMLVLIVVAAVTAFSFYVATVEQQNLNERTALHYKNLENVTVQGVVFATHNATNSSVTLDLSTTDIYTTYVTDVEINGNPATGYCLKTTCSNFTIVGGSTLNLTQFTVTPVTFYNGSAAGQFYLPWAKPVGSMLISIGTTRGNEFQDTLFPPVSKIGLQFVDGYPVLDGSASYQPHEGTFVNATIVEYNWTVGNATGAGTVNDQGAYFGQQIELSKLLTAGAVYEFNLTTTNSIGLSSTASQIFSVP